MRVFAKAELYVLRQSEGGQLATLRSGCNAILFSEGLKTAACLKLDKREKLRAGESGMATLTLSQHETPQNALSFGDAFALSIDGDRAAVGQILSDDSEGACEEIEKVAPVSSEVDDEPPRVVILLSILVGSLFVLLFARNVGALWQKLIAFAVSVAAVVVWSLYSGLDAARDDQYCDESDDARESPSRVL